MTVPPIPVVHPMEASLGRAMMLTMSTMVTVQRADMGVGRSDAATGDRVLKSWKDSVRCGRSRLVAMGWPGDEIDTSASGSKAAMAAARVARSDVAMRMDAMLAPGMRRPTHRRKTVPVTRNRPL